MKRSSDSPYPAQKRFKSPNHTSLDAPISRIFEIESLIRSQSTVPVRALDGHYECSVNGALICEPFESICHSGALRLISELVKRTRTRIDSVTAEPDQFERNRDLSEVVTRDLIENAEFVKPENTLLFVKTRFTLIS